MLKPLLLGLVFVIGLVPQAVLGGTTNIGLTWENADLLEKWVRDEGPDSISPDLFVTAAAKGYAESLEVLFRFYTGKKNGFFKSALNDALLEAVKNDAPECVALLLENGADIHHGPRGREFRTPLWEAIEAKNLPMTRLLVEAGADPGRIEDDDEASLKERIGLAIMYVAPSALFKGFDPVPAFGTAINNGAPEIVKYLYGRISPLNFSLRRKYRKTALYYADQIKTVEMAAVFHELGVPLGDCLSDSKHSPLYYALLDDNTPLVDYLLDQTKAPLHEYTELYIPVMNGNAPQLQRLLEHQKNLAPGWFRGSNSGINVSFSAMGHPYERSTLLEMGIWNGGPEVVRLLLEYGAAPGNQDIVDAVKKKNPETVLMLVEHGADPAEAFFVALAFSQYDLAERLLEANAGIDGSSHKASLALQDAAYEGSAQGVKMLLDAGFSAEALDQNGETALFNALNNDKGTEAVEVVTLLCKAGADPRRIIEGRGYLKMAFEKNLPATAEVLTAFGANEPGMTSFHRAVLTERPEELKSLLERKSASAPILNELLAHAVRYGKPQIVDLLLQAGANPNLVVEEHYPLLYIALMEDHLPVAEILLRHGANADPRLQFMPHDLLELVLEKKKIRAAYLLVKYGVTLSTEERRRSVLQELLKSMPEELPQFLHSCGIHSETSRQQAVDVAKALEFDDKRGKESFQKLFESFQSTHDPRMAALLRALLPDDSLCGYLHSYLHDNLSTGNRGIVRDCLALVPEPGQFRFGRCWYRADDITDQFLEMLPVVLEHSIGLNNNDVGLLLEVLSAKGRSRQFLEFFDHYREKLDESDYAKLLKKVAESPDSALFAELYRRRPVKKTDDNFVLGVARAGNRLGLELLAAQGVDLGSFTWAVTDPFWGYVPYRECYRGVLASFVGYEYGSGRTVGESLKLVAKPDPRDVDHAYRRALSLNSFHVLGDLYRAGFRADKESLEELGTIPGRRYLEMLEQGIDEPLWTSDMLVEVAKGYGEDDLRYLAAILKRGINVNAKDSQGRLALNVAAANNRETTLFLLENGADINARDSEGTSPVIEAASSKPEHIELLRNADTESFEYAAAWCAYNGMTNGFERLAESGFLPEGKFPTRDGEYNILGLAAISGSSAIVSRMLSLLDVPLEERAEALRLAVDRGHFYCTRALLKGVDPRKILIDGVSIRQYIGKSAHSRRLAKLAD